MKCVVEPCALGVSSVAVAGSWDEVRGGADIPYRQKRRKRILPFFPWAQAHLEQEQNLSITQWFSIEDDFASLRALGNIEDILGRHNGKGHISGI